jgi:hypothetical protein
LSQEIWGPTCQQSHLLGSRLKPYTNFIQKNISSLKCLFFCLVSFPILFSPLTRRAKMEECEILQIKLNQYMFRKLSPRRDQRINWFSKWPTVWHSHMGTETRMGKLKWPIRINWQPMRLCMGPMILLGWMLARKRLPGARFQPSSEPD